MKRCLVTGASGFLGREVVRRLSADWEVIGAGFAHASPDMVPLDLRDRGAVDSCLGELNPDAVVHLAAYREPDWCEQNPAETSLLNVEGTRNLSRSVGGNVPILYASTDYVFDGLEPPFSETDTPSPVNLYGRSKQEGEVAVRACPLGIVLRMPLLVGTGASLEESGFIGQMISAIRAQETQQVDHVLMRFPTWTRDVANAFAYLLARGEPGTVHISGLRGGTRYDWTREAAEVLGLPIMHLTPSDAVVPRVATRPPNSQLSPQKLLGMGFGGLTDFRTVVESVLEEIG